MKDRDQMQPIKVIDTVADDIIQYFKEKYESVLLLDSLKRINSIFFMNPDKRRIEMYTAAANEISQFELPVPVVEKLTETFLSSERIFRERVLIHNFFSQNGSEQIAERYFRVSHTDNLDNLCKLFPMAESVLKKQFLLTKQEEKYIADNRYYKTRFLGLGDMLMQMNLNLSKKSNINFAKMFTHSLLIYGLYAIHSNIDNFYLDEEESCEIENLVKNTIFQLGVSSEQIQDIVQSSIDNIISGKYGEGYTLSYVSSLCDRAKSLGVEVRWKNLKPVQVINALIRDYSLNNDFNLRRESRDIQEETEIFKMSLPHLKRIAEVSGLDIKKLGKSLIRKCTEMGYKHVYKLLILNVVVESIGLEKAKDLIQNVLQGLNKEEFDHFNPLDEETEDLMANYSNNWSTK
jgi:hypothetical protein